MRWNEMELDWKGIVRLCRIGKRYLVANHVVLLKKLIAYLYLYGCFTFQVFYYACNVREAVKPLSWLIVSMIHAICYVAYVVVNHLFVRYVIPHKTLLIFDALLLLALLALFQADLTVENL